MNHPNWKQTPRICSYCVLRHGTLCSECAKGNIITPEYTVEFERRDEELQELQKKCNKCVEYYYIKFETEKRIADAREIKKNGQKIY